MSMFSETVSCKLTIDAVSGLPTGVSLAQKESAVAGTIKAITSVLTADEVVVGLGRTMATAIIAYGSAAFAAKQQRGEFVWNPYSGK